LDFSGSVDGSDYGVIDANYGYGTADPLSPAAVPEPGALWMIWVLDWRLARGGREELGEGAGSPRVLMGPSARVLCSLLARLGIIAACNVLGDEGSLMFWR